MSVDIYSADRMALVMIAMELQREGTVSLLVLFFGGKYSGLFFFQPQPLEGFGFSFLSFGRIYSGLLGFFFGAEIQPGEIQRAECFFFFSLGGEYRGLFVLFAREGNYNGLWAFLFSLWVKYSGLWSFRFRLDEKYSEL